MSDIRFNRWLHQSGTGGVYQDSTGRVGIGTSVPTSALDVQSGTIKIGNNTLSSSGVSTFTSVTATTVSATSVVVSAGSTSAPSISPSGDSNTGIFFPSADTVCIGEGGSEVFRVNSSGNIGINNTNPLYPLHINGNSGTLLRLDGGGSTGTRDVVFTEFGTDAYGGIIRYDSVADLFTFGTLENSVVKSAININRASGIVTTPHQPAFNATGAGVNVSYSSGAIFQFSSADLNVGNHFNTSTYKFTAPVAGVYLFGASIYVNGNLSACFTVNGTQTYGGSDVQPLLYSNTVLSISAQLLVSLSANDVVDFRSRDVTASATIYMGHSNFWGYLMG